MIDINENVIYNDLARLLKNRYRHHFDSEKSNEVYFNIRFKSSDDKYRFVFYFEVTTLVVDGTPYLSFIPVVLLNKPEAAGDVLKQHELVSVVDDFISICVKKSSHKIILKHGRFLIKEIESASKLVKDIDIFIREFKRMELRLHGKTATGRKRL